MTLKVVIVEDEKNSREGLRNLIEEFCSDTEVKGMAGSVDEGIAMIKELNPDLVMLDIEMQTATGFDLLEKLGEVNFDVIFTTAYEQYAIKAIKFSAIDYLLKPIDVNELITAVDKVKAKRSSTSSNLQVELLLKNLKLENPKTHKITLSTSEGMVFIPVTDIIRCEAQGAYTTFFLKENKKILVSKNLKEYESLLSDYNFFRIHNSHLINLGEVERYIKSDGGYVVMKDGSQVAISNTRKDEFLELMKQA
ncbi:MAG: response regulator transcription factor [Bacteroidetes bacterium]|nr:MAG: response regulator transcription factor [Bacteroidota bacterium]